MERHIPFSPSKRRIENSEGYTYTPNAANVERAVDSLTDDGGEVHCPVGIYDFAAPLDITTRSVKVIGVLGWYGGVGGRTGTIFRATADMARIIGLWGQWDEMRHICLFGNAQPAIRGVDMNGYDQTLYKCVVHGCRDGVEMYENNQWVVECFIESNSRYGIYNRLHESSWVVKNLFWSNLVDVMLRDLDEAWIIGNRSLSSVAFTATLTDPSENIFMAFNTMRTITGVGHQFDHDVSHIRIVREIMDGGGVTPIFLGTGGGTTVIDGRVDYCSAYNLTGNMFNELGGVFAKQTNYGDVDSYMAADYGAAWAGWPPAGLSPANGTMVTVYNSNAGVLASRLYCYSNGVWRYVALI